MTKFSFADFNLFSHHHLPIVAAYCRTLDLKGVVDRLLPTTTDLSADKAVQAMVLRMLSCSYPLHWDNEDLILLLGEEVYAHLLNETNLGRVLDAIVEVGPSKIITALGKAAATLFDLDMSSVSYSTTSVWGEYLLPEGDPSEQTEFCAELLCVERGVPIHATSFRGEHLDNKTTSCINAVKALHAQGSESFVFVVDTTLVPLKNLSLLEDIHVVSRLPGTFASGVKAVERAVESGIWIPMGRLEEVEYFRSSPEYKAHETTVDIDGKAWRAVVVHTDRQKQKAIDKKQEASLKKITDQVKGVQKRYTSEEDARSASLQLSQMESPLHKVTSSYQKRVVNKKEGSPDTSYELEGEILIREDRLQGLHEQAGCFVLVTNVPSCSLDAKALLRAFKSQYGIESNVTFLEKPLRVHDMLLHTPKRIDALGMLVVVSHLIWRLMERQMRLYLACEGAVVPGWDNKPTNSPTSFMMSTVFNGIQVARSKTKKDQALIVSPLSDRQMQFLTALGLDERVFLDESGTCVVQRRNKGD